MSDQDRFERILEALYDAMLDDARWPAASALIDEACGLTGSGLLVVDGAKEDARACPLGLYYRGEPRKDLEREYLENYHPVDERVPRFRRLANRRVALISDLYTAEELKTGAFPISRSRAHTHRRHGHPLQTVPSAGLIERPQEKNRVDALR